MLLDWQQELGFERRVLKAYRALHSGNDHADVAWSLNDVGVAYENLGKYEQALEYMQRALRMLQALF